MPAERGRRLQTYAALLRGVNLGTRNKISMAHLRALFFELGGEDVTTYVQSGNVVFKTPIADVVALSGTIEAKIKQELGLDVRVLLRSKAQLAQVVKRNPFVVGPKDLANLHVTFLADRPSRACVRELEAKRFEPDEFRLAGLEVYLHCPKGYGRSNLNNAYFEKQLNVAATTRNWRTATKLAELPIWR